MPPKKWRSPPALATAKIPNSNVGPTAASAPSPSDRLQSSDAQDSNAGAPTAAMVSDGSSLAAPDTDTTTNAGQNGTAFYQTGLFVVPPHTYMDLLRAFVEFCVHSMSPLPAASKIASTDDATVGEERKSLHENAKAKDVCHGVVTQQPQSNAHAAPGAAALPSAETQVQALLSVIIPYRLVSYFEETKLLSTDAGSGAAATAVDDSPLASSTAMAEAFESTKGSTRKRHRSEEEAEVNALPLQPKSACDRVVSETAAAAAVMGELTKIRRRLYEYGAAHLPAFDSDAAYLLAKDVCLDLRYHASLVTGMIVDSTRLKHIDQCGLNYHRHCVPCVKAIAALLQDLTKAQLQKMAQLPRVVRLSRRLQLSAKAEHTLEFLLICHCGRYTPVTLANPLRPASIAYHNSLTPQELHSILSESGVLCKQGLIFSNIKLRTSFTECIYAVPMEVIAALSGDCLSEDQLIKLERTALSEVLDDESRAFGGVSAAALVEDDDGGDDLASTAGSDEALSMESQEEALHHHKTAVQPVEQPETIQWHSTGTADSDPVAATRRDAPVPTKEAGGAGANQEGETTLEEVDPPRPLSAAPQATSEGTVETVSQSMGEMKRLGASTLLSEESPRAVGVAQSRTQLTLADINPLAPTRRDRVTAAGEADMPGSPTSPTPLSTSASAALTGSSMRGVPYESDIQYMDAGFRILAELMRIRYAEGDMKDEEDAYNPKTKVEASLRELKGKVRVAASVHKSRLQATLARNTFTPRIEQLAQHLKLTEMEKLLLLFMVGHMISHDILVAMNGRYMIREGPRIITVGYLLFILCETLEERVVARRAFYQSAPLMSNGVLTLTLEGAGRSCFNTDLMDYLVDIDRKIVDDVMGTTAETAELVPGSKLYHPSVEIGKVMLPSATMERVLSTIEHFSLFEQCKRRCGFGDGLGTGSGGLVMLFHGPSGTGKTMLANAVAHHLNRKILLVSIAQLRSSTKTESDALRFLFREAKLSDSIVFFDECEPLFEDRSSNPTVTALLTEFERYEGLIILATNRAQIFDEAMNRRISLMMEFKPPDHQLRLRIWQSHVPSLLALAEDVSLEKLALNYEISGGLIRNAVLAAINRAVAREKTATPTLTMADLDEGARQQLRGFFLAAERPHGMSELYVTPKRTLAELVLDPALSKQLEKIAGSAKSRSTLYTEWGFNEDANEDVGCVYLFQGVSGTGKSLAAEGIAYESGATIRLCNVAELLLREEINVGAVFEEGRKLGAIIVFDEAQVLFNESVKSLQISQLIQYHARRYPRPVIVIASTASRSGSGGGGGRQLFSATSINSRSSCILFQAELTFALPSRQLREKLWRLAFPKRVPLAVDVDYGRLSAFSISPKLIRTIAFDVCSKAALLPIHERTVTMAMIEAEVDQTMTRERRDVAASAMFV